VKLRIGTVRVRDFDAVKKISDLQVVVTDVDAEGRALEAEFRFERELEDASLFWSTWQGSELEPCAPPPLGTSHTLPPIRFEPTTRSR